MTKKAEFIANTVKTPIENCVLWGCSASRYAIIIPKVRNILARVIPFTANKKPKGDAFCALFTHQLNKMFKQE
ncbi:MAG: hypothetical protein CL847_02905 [Crocinitomicaceae bacterium]|nr:hypothetical protein [Crocinitomicaceae bacterium]|tara:strand:+ start:38 stop:256 length:219 start_codon:yes stop_codon:yes gene_type:complete